MKKKSLIGAVLCSLCLITGSAVPASADGMKVVTLGADLSAEQQQTMMNYFKVSSGEAQIIYVTNQDERDHLSAYVPLEQIGTRTVSCAYVKPTTSGGIKVRTANLNWVTGNMIASTLSTSGVTNCEVIAACPFEVSGTGALTGIQMAYETASGEKLDETKKQIATEEMVVTGNLADEVGKNDATTVINQSKMEVIQNGVQNADEIYNIVYNIAQQNNISIDSEQMDKIVALLEEIAQQDYDYDEMKETLERVDDNVTGNTSESSSEESTDEDSIMNVDESVLGDDVIASSTEDPTLEEETGDEYTTEGTDEIPEATGDGDDDVTYVEEPAVEIAELSEQSQSQYDKAKEFCEGEYMGDWEALQSAMGEDFYPSATLDAETGAKLAEKVEQEYYTILSEGTASYVPTGEEEYMSVELNMMQQILKEIFNIDQPEAYSEDGETDEEDILADVSQEDRQLLYIDTLKFFEKMYGENTEDYSGTDSAEYTDNTEETQYDESADSTGETYEETYYEEIPEGTEETY